MSAMRRDLQRFNEATRSSARFVYEYLPRLMLVSVVWVVASLPVVTLGISTLGAYTAVVTIRAENRINWGVVRKRITENGRDATLLAPVPVTFLLISALYFTGTAVESIAVAPVIALVAFYLAAYLALLYVPTFVMLAHGVDAWTALGRARSWLGGHPTLALSMAVVTVIVFAVTALLTITFPLLFAGSAFSYHVIVVEASDMLETEDDADVEVEQTERALA